MNDIKDIRVIEEFHNQSLNTTFGIYEMLFNGAIKVFARQGNEFYLLSHFIPKPELNKIRYDVEQELLSAINGVEIKK